MTAFYQLKRTRCSCSQSLRHWHERNMLTSQISFSWPQTIRFLSKTECRCRLCLIQHMNRKRLCIRRDHFLIYRAMDQYSLLPYKVAIRNVVIVGLQVLCPALSTVSLRGQPRCFWMYLYASCPARNCISHRMLEQMRPDAQPMAISVVASARRCMKPHTSLLNMRLCRLMMTLVSATMEQVIWAAVLRPGIEAMMMMMMMMKDPCLKSAR